MDQDNQAANQPNASGSGPKQKATERLKQANNVLVTVSNNPSVDQLAACIGLTLILNKLGKHATAVYSGKTPSTIEFLKPEETLEKTTDSLRDFIISLDKSKADKLRYKVEDKIVQIFITPYKTSLSEKDLDFSLGDFNVDAVVALGVHQQSELDQAITAHGRILHDATIISVNITPNNELGTINWQDSQTSSLSEMVADLGDNFGKNVFDAQIATALLTGIVAATDRFSNNKTFSETMSISAELIDAGANQQLVATKLEEAKKPPPPPPPPKQAPMAQPPPGPGSPPPPKTNDGTLIINHGAPLPPQPAPAPTKEPQASNDKDEDEDKEITQLDEINLDTDNDDEEGEPISQIDIDKEGTLRSLQEKKEQQENESQAGGMKTLQPLAQTHNVTGGSPIIKEPPLMAGGSITANSQTQGLDPTTDPLSLPPVDEPLLNREHTNFAMPKNPLSNVTPAGEPVLAAPPNAPPILSPAPTGGLPDVDSARQAVEQTAANDLNGPLKPLAALNAQPVFDNLNPPAPAPGAPAPVGPQVGGHQMLSMPVPPTSALGGEVSTNQDDDAPSGAPQPAPSATEDGAAPPVPPPMTDVTKPPFL